MRDTSEILWPYLRNKQLDGERWYKDKTVSHYIVDLYCPKRKLIVDIRSSYHPKKHDKYDRVRADFLTSVMGMKHLLYEEQFVLKNIKKVLRDIKKA